MVVVKTVTAMPGFAHSVTDDDGLDTAIVMVVTTPVLLAFTFYADLGVLETTDPNLNFLAKTLETVTLIKKVFVIQV